MKRHLFIFTLALNILLAGQAQNLILNPSCDDSLVNGNIPHWQEITGTNWTQRCVEPDPLPGNGTCFFFAGADAISELAQIIDVADYASTIDLGSQIFYFHGFEVSYQQIPADEANIFIEFSDAVDTILSTVHFGPYTQSTVWQELDAALEVPPLTRYVTIRLNSVRHNGSNNDGYFDELYLGSAPLTGVSEINSDAVISIYPNPSKGELNISLPDLPKEKATFTLTDLLGRKLAATKIVSEDTSLQLEQPNGIYLVIISTASNIYVEKIIIER